jgi:hypothetical protein
MQTIDVRRIHKDYIDANVHPIFEKILVDILLNKPHDIVSDC